MNSFRSAIEATQDSLVRLDPATDPHTFNMLKALQFIAEGLNREMADQDRKLQALTTELQRVKSLVR